MPTMQQINNGEQMSAVRAKLNANFETAYPTIVPLSCTTGSATNLTVASHANKILELTVTGSAGLYASVVLSAGSWAAGDRVTVRLVSLTTAAGVNITSASGTMTPASQIFFGQTGGVVVIKRNAANNGWNVEQSLPLYPVGGGMEAWLRNGSTVKATVSSTDFIWAAGSDKVQYSNNATTNGALVECGSEGTLSTNDVTGTYALTSRSRIFTQQVDYSGQWKVGVALMTAPHYRTTGLIPTGVPSGVVGKRHAALALDSTRYSDSKHWGGLLIGSISGASYNGVWGYFDDYGNWVMARGIGVVSEQRDTGTASFTVADNIAQVALAGSGTVTVTLPQVPFDGQELSIFLETAYTGVTLSSGAQGASIIGGTIGTAAGSFARFSYRAAGDAWRRCG